MQSEVFKLKTSVDNYCLKNNILLDE